MYGERTESIVHNQFSDKSYVRTKLSGQRRAMPEVPGNHSIGRMSETPHHPCRRRSDVRRLAETVRGKHGRASTTERLVPVSSYDVQWNEAPVEASLREDGGRGETFHRASVPQISSPAKHPTISISNIPPLQVASPPLLLFSWKPHFTARNFNNGRSRSLRCQGTTPILSNFHSELLY
jgi:hypothetical protein